MKVRLVVLTAAFAASCIYSWTAAANDDRESEATIATRQRFFGAENVDARTGQVRRDRVIAADLLDLSFIGEESTANAHASMRTTFLHRRYPD